MAAQGDPAGVPPASGRVVVLPAHPAAEPGPAPAPPTARQRLVGAGLGGRAARVQQLLLAAVGAHIAAVVAGLVGADYVEAKYFGLIVPALAGFACAAWVIRAAPAFVGPVGSGLAAGYAVCSAAFAFVYADTPFGAVGTWLPPLLCAAAGALAWPYIDPSPPAKKQPKAAQDSGTTTTVRMPDPPGVEHDGPTT